MSRRDRMNVTPEVVESRDPIVPTADWTVNGVIVKQLLDDVVVTPEEFSELIIKYLANQVENPGINLDTLDSILDRCSSTYHNEKVAFNGARNDISFTLNSAGIPNPQENARDLLKKKFESEHPEYVKQIFVPVSKKSPKRPKTILNESAKTSHKAEATVRDASLDEILAKHLED